MSKARRTIVVTGGCGNVGSRLVRRLARADSAWRVRALVLPNDPFVSRLDDVDCEVIEGDITRPDTLRGALDGADTVYHLAAVILSPDATVFERVNVEGTRNVVHAAVAAGARHLIFVSSASVVYPNTTPYSRSKREAERIVRTEGRALRPTIARPTLVYERDGGEEFILFADYLRRFPIVPFVGAGAALKRPVHADDLITGLAAIPGAAAAPDRIYNLSGGEALSIRELARLILVHRGPTRPIVSIPVPLCRAVASAMKRVMKAPPLTHQAISGIIQDADLDPGDAMRDLDYAPRGVRAGLAAVFSEPNKSG